MDSAYRFFQRSFQPVAIAAADVNRTVAFPLAAEGDLQRLVISADDGASSAGVTVNVFNHDVNGGFLTDVVRIVRDPVGGTNAMLVFATPRNLLVGETLVIAGTGGVYDAASAVERVDGVNVVTSQTYTADIGDGSGVTVIQANSAETLLAHFRVLPQLTLDAAGVAWVGLTDGYAFHNADVRGAFGTEVPRVLYLSFSATGDYHVSATLKV